MVFSIEQINKNPNLLPNITMGFRFYDSCRMMQRSIQGSLWLMTGHNQPVPQFCCQRKPLLVGTVGDAGSSGSIVIARLQGLYRVSQISYVSTSPLLSDRHHFPSFLRTIPSDSFQSRGLAQLVLYFGWTWVGILVEDNDYGQLGGTLLKKELDGTSACVAFSENIILSRADRNALHIIQVIKSSSASAIVVFSSDAGLSPLVDEMVRQNLTGRVWIASEGWSTSTLMSMEKYLNVLNMTIGLAIHSGEMPGFLEHLNNVHPSSSPDDALLPKFWEEAFGCKWPDPKVNFSMSQNTAKLCTGAEKLGSIQTSYNDMATLRAPYNIYRAVYAFANALHNLSSCRKGQGPFHQGTCANIMDFQPWQLLHYVKKVYFQTKDGYQSLFNENGEVPAQYDIINWHRDTDGTVRHVTVGSYDLGLPLGQNLIINDSAVQVALLVTGKQVKKESPSAASCVFHAPKGRFPTRPTLLSAPNAHGISGPAPRRTTAS
ncbi:hypothetical protein NDU88_000641 [Pleurodeles waltl]|uniref:Receptor ligand binding region domain-containing protein n=1 Tax=Pleurodeles waltl TaxID=8319 RepID=A0AAV7KPY7_PLEWA|nr:hypothetical protein NDU88_000641 [Pleurodeles waltl]